MTSPKLAYLIRMFPQISETFIANEILGLERLGLELELYSYRRPRDRVLHQCVREIQTPVTYLPDPLNRNVRQLWAANARAYRVDPARFRRVTRSVFGQAVSMRNPDVWRRFIQAAYLADLISAREVGHLHAHFAHRATQVTLLASMLSAIPFSFTAHAKDIYTTPPARLRHRIRAASFVVTCTQANAGYLRSIVDEDQRHKIHLCYHGVDVEKFSPDETARSRQPPVVLAVGRLVPKKGHRYLIEACGVLRDLGYDFRCVVVGKGPERRALEELIRERGLSDIVELAGPSTQEELVERYRAAMIFALPCVVERNGDRDGLPNTLAEAMAVGLPVVSTPVSAVPELVRDGDDGLLVEERNAEALARALGKLIDDEPLRRRLGTEARRTVVEKFDSRRNVELLGDLFSDLGAAPPGRSFASGMAAVASAP